MGIIHQVAIRCFKVKDLGKVDETVLSEDECYSETEAYQSQLQAYYKASKENVETVLAIYDHDPNFKWDTLTDIFVPKETNVVAFGNNACDRLGYKCYYYVVFYNYNGQQIKKRCFVAKNERNNFMVVVPKETHSFDYWLDDKRTDSDKFDNYNLVDELHYNFFLNENSGCI